MKKEEDINIDYNLSQALGKASERLRKKMLHSVELLRKAEKIALNYDAENGFKKLNLFTMNENIDLTKILKDCPIGWKFYSGVYGDVEFLGVSHGCPVPLHGQDDEWYLMEDLMHKKYPIRIKTRFGEYDVSHEGKLRVGAGECTLFPSKDQRDWSKFTAPWHKKERFDPKTLKPFDKVIARSYCDDEWDCDIFSHINQEYSFPYVCIGQAWKCCIPYNDDTKHLVGTKEEAPEYYRYWED